MRKLNQSSRTQARLDAKERAAAQRIKDQANERDYWVAWAELIGLGWTLYGWTQYHSASFYEKDLSRVIRVDSDILRAFHALAGARAPKMPRGGP